jgi:translation initiation factor 1
MAKGKSAKPTASSRLVYSTEQGPSSRRPGSTTKAISKLPARAPADDIVRVSRQTRGRKGKGVSVVKGLALPAEELTKLAGELKKMCGSGGTTRDATIEIQGDHLDRIIEELRRRGWKVKKAGG